MYEEASLKRRERLIQLVSEGTVERKNYRGRQRFRSTRTIWDGICGKNAEMKGLADDRWSWKVASNWFGHKRRRICIKMDKVKTRIF